MSKKFIRTFSRLPLKGQVKDQTKYWSSDYWPLNRGNINYRWNSVRPVGFNLKSPSFKEAAKMSFDELAELSPSEKFDLLNARYEYPLKQQVAKRSSPRRKDWEGICHGWAPAALNHREPGPKVMTNPHGIKIPLGSSDIKALLSYYYAYHYRPVSTHQMGRRCNGEDFCKDDMNAGAFHIVLANKVGLEKVGFIADIENGREVWNHVAHDYQTEVVSDNLPPGPDSAPGTVKIVRVKTKFRVVFNIVRNSWEAVKGTSLQTFRENDYEYDLDIDNKGEIIGGDWRSTLRPDFLWTVQPVRQFSEEFKLLPRLL